MNPPLPQSFYLRETVTVAKALLGCVLINRVDGQILSGTIVETEAYLGEDDKACHASVGRTRRNAAMFGPAGHAYVYFVYGMHYCVNAVTREAGVPEAVLIRALSPQSGINTMRINRRNRKTNKTPSEKELTNGPAKLCQALGIGGDLNGCSLMSKDLYIAAGSATPERKIAKGPRIGVNYSGLWKEKPLRFWISGDANVSR